MQVIQNFPPEWNDDAEVIDALSILIHSSSDEELRVLAIGRLGLANAPNVVTELLLLYERDGLPEAIRISVVRSLIHNQDARLGDFFLTQILSPGSSTPILRLATLGLEDYPEQSEAIPPLFDLASDHHDPIVRKNATRAMKARLPTCPPIRASTIEPTGAVGAGNELDS